MFDTVACQTGIVMALSVLAKNLHRNRVSAAVRLSKVCDKVEKIGIDKWVTFFSAFESLYLSNLEANSWPRFQKLFVRIFCKELDGFVKHPEWSPDYEMVLWRASEILEGLAESGKPIKDTHINDALTTALQEAQAAFQRMADKLLRKALIAKRATKALKDLVQKIEKQRKEAASAALPTAPAEEGEEESEDQI